MELKTKKTTQTSLHINALSMYDKFNGCRNHFWTIKIFTRIVNFVDAATCGTDRPKLGSIPMNFFVYGKCINMKRAISFYFGFAANLTKILTFKYRIELRFNAHLLFEIACAVKANNFF